MKVQQIQHKLSLHPIAGVDHTSSQTKHTFNETQVIDSNDDNQSHTTINSRYHNNPSDGNIANNTYTIRYDNYNNEREAQQSIYNNNGRNRDHNYHNSYVTYHNIESHTEVDPQQCNGNKAMRASNQTTDNQCIIESIETIFLIILLNKDLQQKRL